LNANGYTGNEPHSKTDAVNDATGGSPEAGCLGVAHDTETIQFLGSGDISVSACAGLPQPLKEMEVTLVHKTVKLAQTG
jgi:hypothetical protein